jgi:MFS transporter, PHS family, inorganic phosphate transporter
MAEQKSAVAPPAAPKSNFVASVANFSVQYNLSCAAIALEIMKSDHGVKIPDDDTGAVSPHTPDFAEPAWADKTLLGMVFAGAVMGMVGMGYLGDVIGRRRALLLTLGFIIVGALGSGLFSWGADGTVYGVICACRILTGIGVGGIYPLSASEASEGSAADEHAGTRVGWAFFWQTPGAMAPYVIAWLMLVGHPSYAAIARPSSLLFRLLFVIGAVPAAVVWRAAYLEPENEACARARKKAAGTGGASPLREALAHPEYFKTLVGTGGTWFIYDIAYYGIGTCCATRN